MADTPVTPTPIGSWPTAPQRTDAPATFVTRADAWVAATPTRSTEMNALATNVNYNSTSAFDSASEAAVDAATASAAAISATSTANAALWVSGTTYSLTDSVISPSDWQTYRRKIAGAGTTDPSADSTNWELVGAGGSKLTISERTANAILVGADVGNLIEITANTFTQTMTDAATLGSGWFVRVYNSGTGVVTLDPDGAETINGAATLAIGSGQTALVSCDGSNFLAVVYAAYVGDHHILVTTGNGYASTNSKIRIFTTIQSSSGTAITYATSGTAGNSFTINEDGLYEISYVDGYSTDTAVAGFGISVNSNQLTTGVNSITAAHRVAFTGVYGFSGAGNGAACVTRTLRLSAGDVVRAHVGSSNAPNTTNASSSQFSITKVGI